MAVLESRDYQAARERLKGNPVIAMMAAGVVAVPLAELAHQDGTPGSHLMGQANRTSTLPRPATQPTPPTSRTRRTRTGTSAWSPRRSSPSAPRCARRSPPRWPRPAPTRSPPR